MLERDSVSVLLYNEGRFLLQKREGTLRLFPSYWVTFGGAINPEEKPEGAAVRVVREKLGYKINPESLSYLGKVRVMRELDQPHTHFFSAPLLVNLRELKLEQGDGFAYFYQEEFQYLQIRPEDRLALERYFENQGFGWTE